jgi:Ca2+-binding RTX toxin-like protein
MDDFRNTPCGPGPLGDLSFGGEHGYIERAGDRDVFAITLIAGLSYTFTTEPEGDSTALVWGGAMSVRERHGAVVGVDPLGYPLEITALTTGLHDVTVSAAEAGDTGRYSLDVTPGRATEGDDLVRGTQAMDRVEGWLGDDRIYGGGGDDILWGDGQFAFAGGDDRIFGGAGDDILYGDEGRDTFVGGIGDDYYGDVTAEDVVRERPGEGDDIVFYDDETDYVLPENVERLSLYASAFSITASGNVLDNMIMGSWNDDRLFGRSGDDDIDGNDGDDLLVGGRGADALIGGPGSDVFRFGALDSSGWAPDVLRADYMGNAFEGAGAAGGDRIDLSRIDADPAQAGRQALVFAEAPGAGRVWARESGEDTLVRADFDGAPGAELAIRIEDGGAVAAADYAGIDFIL